ncbi:MULTISPECIES: hypothetical protein [Micrococcaceae]|jgi:hypothetical protein|uniref:Uncharacterized protein n=2 Tax=Micrococcaceae TaxID=1268 RepID=A0A1H0XK40_9MICC|nr:MULTISPECIES: hypothetical protein [Micrococcaceae]SDQ03318.1 hypothetical protein SAMN04489742_0064 [Arthrobacter crystallopoietes]
MEFDFFGRELDFPDSAEHDVWSFAADIGKPVVMADVVSHDGRPFRHTNDPNGPGPLSGQVRSRS